MKIIYLLLLSFNLNLSVPLLASTLLSLKGTFEGVLSGLYGDQNHALQETCFSDQTIQQIQNMAADLLVVLLSQDSTQLARLAEQFANLITRIVDQCSSFTDVAALVHATCIEEQRCTFEAISQNLKQNAGELATHVIRIGELRADLLGNAQVAQPEVLIKQIEFHYGGVLKLLISKQSRQKYIAPAKKATIQIKEKKSTKQLFLQGVAKGLVRGEAQQTRCQQEMNINQDNLVRLYKEHVKHQKGLKLIAHLLKIVVDNFKGLSQECQLKSLLLKFMNFKDVRMKELLNTQYGQLMSAMTMLALNESYERAGVAFAEGLARIGDISQI